MRVTAETREKTKQRILVAARNLFSQKGFDEATTRDIAAEADIATGTLFNYYPSKEALGMSLVAEALEEADADFRAKRRGDESLDELLFAQIATGLRRLTPYRQAVGPIVESGLSPFSTDSGSAGEQLRAAHLEAVGQLIGQQKRMPKPSFVAMHLYWSLYLGVLAFWSSDASPNQEDTLVVLDQSLRLFVASLTDSAPTEELSRGT